MDNIKILDGGDGTAPKALPEDTSEIGEDGVPLTPRDHSGVQFLSPSRDSKNGDAKVELGGIGVPQFVGLGKEELMRYANDPFWVRLRWFLFILFWVIWVAMLVTAIVIIVMAPKCSSSVKVSTHLINSGPYYQLSLNSAAADVTDKFVGLQQHVNYINDMGVKTVIISQFQDPANLKSVDPAFGTLKTLEELVAAFRQKAIRVLFQLSPNHSNRDHPWFNSYPDYYVIKDSELVNQSTWKSLYGTKAWSPVGDDGSKSYLHQFLESEADLNYKNTDLVKEMNEVLKHWYKISDGVYGFLLSDVSYLIEDLEHLDNQNSTFNQQGNKDVLEQIMNANTWELGTRLGPYALLDVDHLDAKQSMEMYTGDSFIPILKDLSSQLPVNFTVNDLQSHVESVKSHFVIRRLSNPRSTRMISRFTPDRAHILAMVAFLLHGEVIVYYGDEIGLPNSILPHGSSLDVSGERMNWNPDADASKIMNFYKTLGEIHKSINQTNSNNDGETVYYVNEGVFAFKRDKYIVVANLNEKDTDLSLSVAFKVSGNGALKCSTPNTAIPTDEPLLATSFKASGNSGYVIAFS